MQDKDPVMDMLARMADGGWDSLNVTSETIRETFKASSSEQALAEAREAAIVAAALNSNEGRAFLDLLALKTVLLPPTEEERAATTPESYALPMARREGRNRLFFLLLAMLRAHHGQSQPQQTGGEL